MAQQGKVDFQAWDPENAISRKSTETMPARPAPPLHGENHHGYFSAISNKIPAWIKTLLLMTVPSGIVFGFFAAIPMLDPIGTVAAQNMVWLLVGNNFLALTAVAQYECMFNLIYTFRLRGAGILMSAIPNAWFAMFLLMVVGWFPHISQLASVFGVLTGPWMGGYMILQPAKKEQNHIRFVFLRLSAGGLIAAMFFFVCVLFQFGFSIVNELWAKVLITIAFIAISKLTMWLVDRVFYSNTMKFCNHFFTNFQTSMFLHLVWIECDSPYVYLAVNIIDWLSVYTMMFIARCRTPEYVTGNHTTVMVVSVAHPLSVPAQPLTETELADLQDVSQDDDGKVTPNMSPPDTPVTLAYPITPMEATAPILPPQDETYVATPVKSLSDMPSAPASPRDTVPVLTKSRSSSKVQYNLDSTSDNATNIADAPKLPFLSKDQTEEAIAESIRDSDDFTYAFKDDEWLVKYGSKTEEGDLELKVRDFFSVSLAKAVAAPAFILASVISRHGLNAIYMPTFLLPAEMAFNWTLIYAAIAFGWTALNVIVCAVIFNKMYPNFETKKVLTTFYNRHFFNLMCQMLSALALVVYYTLYHYGITATLFAWRYTATGMW